MKILAITEQLNTGASIPRVHSLETIKGIDLAIRTSFGNADLEWCDVLYVHRPTNPDLLASCKIAKQMGKKVWVDNDDDQLSVPIDHPNYFFFNNPLTKHCIKESNKIADVVTISNPQILESYGHLNKNIVYYPCAYPDKLFENHAVKERNRTVLWRGTYSTKSLLEYKDSIIEVANKNPDWEFVFIGEHPWFITENLKNRWYVYKDFVPPNEFFPLVQKIKPSIQMGVFADNQFTKSRSNMGFLDATIAGALMVAPDWSHWNCPTIRNYSSKEEFVFQIDKLMKMFDNGFDSSFEINKARKWILRNQSFSAINKIQEKIIKSLGGDYVNRPDTASNIDARASITADNK